VRGNVSKYHRKWVGKVVNYYRKAQAIEIELFNGQLQNGQELIIENKTNFYYNFKITSLKIDDKIVEKTPIIDGKNHIFVGIKVDKQVPINSEVYLFQAKEN
jgi:putative protease